MISIISQKLTASLIAKQLVKESEQELYVYGFFMLISQLFYALIAISTGAIAGCIIESIVFFLSFMSIRKYAGGYHASTELRCNIMSVASIILCILLIKLSKVHDIQLVLVILCVTSSLSIFLFSPLDTPQKPLTHNECIHFKKITYIIMGTLIITLFVCKHFFLISILSSIELALTLEGILLVLGKIKKIKSSN